MMTLDELRASLAEEFEPSHTDEWLDDDHDEDLDLLLSYLHGLLSRVGRVLPQGSALVEEVAEALTYLESL